MTLTFDWFLPTSGDGRTIVGRGHSIPLTGPGTGKAVGAQRPPDLDYLGQVARSAEQLGFAAVLTPTGTWCEDAWLATAALIGPTSRLKFLVAFRPGLISPTLAAQMAATYQRLSRGRLLLNVVTGGQASEQLRFGDHLSHDERYAGPVAARYVDTYLTWASRRIRWRASWPGCAAWLRRKAGSCGSASGCT